MIKRLKMIGLMALVAAQMVAVEDWRTVQLEPLEVVHTSRRGVDSVSALYMRKWEHRSDLIEYLEAHNDHVIIENHTTGGWWQPDRLSIGMEGIACQQIRFSIDGVRTDDLFQPGSTQFVPNMQRYNLWMNTHSGFMRFECDTLVGDYIEATYNTGMITNGEPMAGTTALINIFHDSPVQSSDRYKHTTARRHQKGAGQLDGAFTLHDKDGNAYRQHIFAIYGQREITREDVCGLITDEPYYNAPYYKALLDGDLPMKPNKVFSRLGYRLGFAGQTDAGSTYLYNYNEVYDLKNYTAQLYAFRPGLTTALTWATNTVRHGDREFRRNILDQDGESFEPWIADGNTHTLSLQVDYEKQLLPWMKLRVETMNSAYMFRPTEEKWSNTIYIAKPDPSTPTLDESTGAWIWNYRTVDNQDLYRYDWDSHAFAGGLMENKAGIEMNWSPNRKIDLYANVGLTLDGMLLRGKSKVTPNVEAEVGFDLHPNDWFEMGVSLGHFRSPYTTEMLRYMSDDYMNASVTQLSTDMLLRTTGGAYHHYRKGLWQQSYFEIDLPIRFHWGRHEIVLQQSMKQYYHMWHTQYLGGADEYGYYVPQDDEGTPVDVFYEDLGEKQYEVGYTPSFGRGLFGGEPYHLSQLSRYTYTGKRVLVSLSWQSQISAGFVGLGNGPNSNSYGILTEQTANPNVLNILTNPEQPNMTYRGVSRMDLDKGFVLRFYLSYNICKWVQAGLTLKWTDGKPFTPYTYFEHAGQVAILPNDSRGTNPIDQNFGSRHCANWDVDLHLQGQWMVNNYPMRLRLECYNLWDFCCDQAEMAFVQGLHGTDAQGRNYSASRASMIMNVPTGLKLTFGCDLTPVK